MSRNVPVEDDYNLILLIMAERALVVLYTVNTNEINYTVSTGNKLSAFIYFVNISRLAVRKNGDVHVLINACLLVIKSRINVSTISLLGDGVSLGTVGIYTFVGVVSGSRAICAGSNRSNVTRIGLVVYEYIIGRKISSVNVCLGYEGVLKSYVLRSIILGSVVGMSRSHLVSLDVNLSGVLAASATLIDVVAVNAALGSNLAYVSLVVMSKSRKVNVVVVGAKNAELNSLTHSGTSSRSGYVGLNLIPLVVVGVSRNYVILTNRVGNLERTCLCSSGLNTNGYTLVDCNTVSGISASLESTNLTIVELVAIELAVLSVCNGFPGVTGSGSRNLFVVVTIQAILCNNVILGTRACGNNRLRIYKTVRKLGNSKNAVRNPLSRYFVTVCSLNSLGRNGSFAGIRAVRLCRSTANAASVEPEAVKSTAGISVCDGSCEVVVMLSRIYGVSLGNVNDGISILIESKLVTNRALEVCLNTVLLTGVRLSCNVAPCVTESRNYKIGCRNFSSSVK